MLHDSPMQVKPRSKRPPVRYCSLHVRNEGLPTMHFEVRIKVGTVLLNKISTTDLTHVVKFLSQYGVSECETRDSLLLLENNGHNVIEFGMCGTPTITSFEGSLQ